MENNKINSIEMTARFSNFEVINSEFTRARCNVFYTGRNRNYSDITEEALDKFVERKGYANVPVVAHLIQNEDGSYMIGGHDQTLVMTRDSIDLIDETVPFGVIPEDCNPSMELITEKSGEQHNYFSVDIILWTHRYPILDAAYSDEIYFNQSMELQFTETEYDDDYVVVNDFNMSALCLLNKSTDADENVEPCFESSMVKKFSIDEEQFKQNFEILLEKINEFESEENAPEPDEDSSVQDTQKNEPTSMKGDQKMELSKFAEVLSTVKIDGKEDDKYALLDTSDSLVYAIDMEDYKPYAFDYAITMDDDTESIVIDFESKVEMSLSATEKITEEGFTEFDITAAIEAGMDDKVAECTASLNKKYDELQTQYEELIADYEVATQKIKEYEAAEKAAQEEIHKAEVDSLFEKYAGKLGNCAEFLVYKAKVDPAEVSIEELEETLTLMAGKYMMKNASKASFSYTPAESGVDTSDGNTASGRYGNLLDGYCK